MGGRPAAPADDTVCHCFGFRRADILDELRRKGVTDIPGRIREKTRNGECDCERLNPSGRCCLGDVLRVVDELRARLVDLSPRGEISPRGKA